jgi:hypothetical protein
MDLSQCRVFSATAPLVDFVSLASGFPTVEEAEVGCLVGLHAVATLSEHELHLASPGFLFKTPEGGLVRRHLVDCIDHGLMDRIGLDTLRAYGSLTLAQPPSMELAGHAGWMFSTTERGVDMRDVLLLREGAVVANTIHHVEETPDDPAFFDGWAIVVAKAMSAHDQLAQAGKIAALQAQAVAWARTHLPAERIA